jgi:uncharacterized membrane protein
MPFGPTFGKKLLTREDDVRVIEAIGRAEKDNRGEVRVHLERKCIPADPMDRAREVFAALDMYETEEQTGVLLYVSLEPRVCCVFAGQGIHGAAKEGFWDEVIDKVAGGFSSGQAAKGLVDALDAIGDLLRQEVPGEDTAGNELPNTITTS